jgi:hypothetical protein
MRRGLNPGLRGSAGLAPVAVQPSEHALGECRHALDVIGKNTSGFFQAQLNAAALAENRKGLHRLLSARHDFRR